MKPGLPAKYIKAHHGNMKAAWAAYKKDRGAPAHKAKTHKAKHKTKGRPHHAAHHAHAPTRHDALEAWSGAIAELKRATDGTAHEVHKHDKLHTLGHRMAHALRETLRRHKMGRAEWAALYDAALRTGAHAETGGWISPLQYPTRVTSGFGAEESGLRSSPHTGVDLAAPAGSTVVAPVDLKIVSAKPTADGNLVVHAVARRPDGRFPSDAFGAGFNRQSDTGWRLEFDHLSALFPGIGDDVVVPQGKPFAFSGGAVGAEGSGLHTTGPHLHFALQWVQENPLFNDRVYVDPIALIGPSAGGANIPPAKHHTAASGTAKAITAPHAGQPGAVVEAGERSTKVVIVNNGVVGIGQTNTYQANQVSGGAGAGEELDYAGVSSVGPMSTTQWEPSGWFGAVPGLVSKVLHGLGSLAGRTFEAITSPQGIALVEGGASAGLGIASAGAGVASILGPLLAPAVTLIPYAGEILGPLFEAAGPVGKIAAPILEGGASALQLGGGIPGLMRPIHHIPATAIPDALREHLPFLDFQGLPVFAPPMPSGDGEGITALVPILPEP